MNFEYLTIEIHVHIISSMLTKFQEDQGLSIKCLNFKFLWRKIMYKK